MDSNRFILRTQMLIEKAHQADGIVLIDGHNGTMCSCNATAATLLLRLAEGATGDELVEALTMAFDISGSVARRDATHFLESLSAMGFLATAEAGPTPRMTSELAVA